METQTEVGLKSILEKYFQNIEELKRILPENQYRKSFAILTVQCLMEIYAGKGIKYTRMDLCKKTNLMLEKNGMEKYSYYFYRQFA